MLYSIFYHYPLQLFHGNHFATIIFLSLAIYLLLLPVQYLIDRFFQKSIEKKKKIQPLITEISEVYSGQARYYYLKTLYRQHSISSAVDLIPVLKLLVQVPFFLIMYRIMSNHPSFIKQSAFFLNDLSSPDRLIPFAGIGINLLPLLMFIFNLMSTFIHCKENPKDKVTLHFTNIMFLALLYNMPSGLVLYWTCNNLINLISESFKNKGLEFPLGFGAIKDFFQKIPYPLFFNVLFLHAFFVSYNISVKDSQSFHLAYWARFLFLALSFLSFYPIVRRNVLYGLVLCCIFTGHFFFAHNLALLAVTQAILFFFYARWSKDTYRDDENLYRNIFFAMGCCVPLFAYIKENFHFIPNLKVLFELISLFYITPVMFIMLISHVGRKTKINFHPFLLSALVFCILVTPMYLDHILIQSEVSYSYQLLLLIMSLFLFINLRKYAYETVSLIALVVFSLSVVRIYKPVKNIALSEKKVKDEFIKLDKAQRPFKVAMSSIKPVKKPDIYLLIYDAYPGPKLMKFYGFDNDQQYQFLKDKGFALYGDKLSFQKSSLSTMSTTFEMNPKLVLSARRYMVGSSRLNWYLKENGYDPSYILTPYYALGQDRFFQGNIIYSSSSIKEKHLKAIKKENIGFSEAKFNFILAGLWEGEFKFDIDEAKDQNNDKKLSFFDLKQSILKNDSELPRFLYAHSRNPGHSQNSGICLDNENERFYNKLKLANEEMIADIDVILSKNRDAIIIVAGDHGAYLTGNCRGFADPRDKNKNNITQLADTHGLFIAIRWPDSDYLGFDQFHTMQDLFLAVLAYMTQDKTPLSFAPSIKSKICHHKNCVTPDGTILDDKHRGENLFDAIQNYPLEVYRP